MVDWLVITADAPGIGRGVRGYALVWFLRTYFGRRRVRVCTPKQIRDDADVSAKRCLIGLPSSLTAEDLDRLAARAGDAKFAMFDYRDQHELAWTTEQEPALRRLSNQYLKPWFEPSWDYDLRMGLLPIRRYGRFTTALRIDRAISKVGIQDERNYDVGFVGRPNLTRFYEEGEIRFVDQRAQWIHDLKRQAADLRFWGGLVGIDDERRKSLESKFGDISSLLHSQQKVRFGEYYRSLKRSRVVLAPGGNVPWTYRHYECLYSGAAVVSIDYRRRDMLVPLPRDLMIHVPDGQCVAPAVQEALERFRRERDLGQKCIAHLERYLLFGAYSRRRSALIQRFVSQFE